MNCPNTVDIPSCEPHVTGIDATSVRTLPEMFEAACAHYARRPAFSSFNHTLEYRDVAQYVHRFSAFLVNELKLESCDRVALILPNGLPYVVAFYGVLDAGLVVVNVNPQSYPFRREICCRCPCVLRLFFCSALYVARFHRLKGNTGHSEPLFPARTRTSDICARQPSTT
jgi:acyl-CoA synthetase (AMP-forming)/AMP-acid ligase II